MYLGLVFFTDISCHKTDTHLIPCVSFFLRLSPHFPAHQVSRYGDWTVSADVHEVEKARLNEVHRSFQECGSTVRSFLHVTLLAPKIWIRPSVF